MKKRFFKNLFGLLAVFAAVGLFLSCKNDDSNDGSGKTPHEEEIVAVSKIELNKAELVIEEKKSETLVATIIPSNAKATISWLSANENIAIVDDKGVVRGVNEGNTVITAKAEEKSASCIVTVFKNKGEFTQAELRTLYSNYESTTKIEIPEGYTSIASNAFDGCISLETLTTPATMKTISGISSSARGNLKNVTIKGGTISESAFKNYPVLESVSIEFAKIEKDSIRNNQKLKTVTINSCEISDAAFRNSPKLETVTIKNSKIGMDSFRECPSLTTLNLEQVKSLDINAFQDCSALERVTFDEYITSIGNYAFRNCTALKTVTFGNGECSIDNYAFRNCTSLKTVKLDGVVSIGEYAFRDCESLENITIPSSVLNIEAYVFLNTSLKSIAVDSGNKNYTSDDGILYNKDKTELVYYPCNKEGETFTIPNGVKTIERAAFRGNYKLRSVIICDDVESIFNSAFKGSVLLESVTIGKNVSFIGSEAFRIENLSSVTFKDPTGWWYSLREDATSGATIDVDYDGSNSTPTGNSTTPLSNPTTAAAFLQGAFLLSTPSDINGSSVNESRYWFKKEKIDTPATSIIFTEDSYKIPLGESFTLPVTIEPSNTSDKTVAWNSSNPSVIAVESGVLVAKSAGSSTITATTTNGKTATCSVTIPDNTGTCDAEWNFNEIEHWGNLFGGYDANGSGAYFPLSNARLDPTSGNGADVFLTTGGIRLRGDSSNGAHLQSQSTSGVNVSSPDSIKKSKSVFTVHLYGDKTTLTLKMRASSSTPTTADFTVLRDSKGATLTLSDGSSAAIQLDGTTKTFTVEELPQGTYYIYTNSSRIYSITTTNKPVTSITLSQNSMQLPIGGTAKLTAIIEPEDARSKKVTLTSNNESVVSVENGVLSVKSSGTAKITATSSNGLTATCNVTVPDPSIYKYEAEWDFRETAWNAWEGIFPINKSNVWVDLWESFDNLNVPPSSGSGMDISLTATNVFINRDHFISSRGNDASIENFTKARAVFTLQVLGNDTTLEIDTVQSGSDNPDTRFTILCDSKNKILKQPNGDDAMVTVSYNQIVSHPVITVKELPAGTYYLYSNGSDIFSIKATNYTIDTYNYSYDNLLSSMFADYDSDGTNLKDDQVDIKKSHFNGENAFLSLTETEGSTVKNRNTSNCIEIKNEALKVTFKGTGSIAINATSNGGSNTSSLALKKSDETYVRGSYTNENISANSKLNHYIITGTSGAKKEINDENSTTITFNITEPGDYIICTLATVVADGEEEVENNTDIPTRIHRIRMIDRY